MLKKIFSVALCFMPCISAMGVSGNRMLFPFYNNTGNSQKAETVQTGDFTELERIVGECREWASTATTGFAPNAVAELLDKVTLAEMEIASVRASQTVIDSYVSILRVLLDRAKATANYSPKRMFPITANHGFVHPGGIVSQDDVNRTRQLLADGDERITKAWNMLCNNNYSHSDVATYPTATVIRGGNSGQNYMNAARGAAMAFQNALRWKIAGTKENADAAVRILMAWCNGCNDVGGDTNMSLAAGIYGHEFANAAELMRDYDGWKKDDFEKFKLWMVRVWYNKSIDFLRRRHDTWLNQRYPDLGERPGHYWSNWGLCNALCVMSIGILCDDVHMYNQGASFYKYDHVGTFKDRSGDELVMNDGCNEFIGNLVPVVLPDERGPLGYLGQMQESGRDQGHTLMALGLAVDICQVGFNQGDDLYGYMNDRIAAVLLFTAVGISLSMNARRVTIFTTTQTASWVKGQTALTANAEGEVVAVVGDNSHGVKFEGFGTTFNELDWDAFNMLSRKEQDELMYRMFSPDGDLKFTHGRVSMNANDYSRAWYSCDDVDGDFALKHFNIEHDKRNIIPLARAAQKYQPSLRLFMSPWSPPVWMKINHDYPVSPSRYNNMDERQAYLLYMDDGRHLDADEMKLLGDRNGVFPRKLASQDYFIQDPRYLQCYADMFCRFIEMYKEEGLPITKVMYQNEAYSYTPYPGCPWTAEGTLRFNNDYLAPALAKAHPEVELWIGTFNTNRLDYVEKILDDKTLQANIKGIGTQWECRNNLPQMRSRYPNHRFMVSESECGNGSMDWKAGEHTFFLLSDNIGNGCDEYYNWNFILADNGKSPWGWSQNALVQVDSKTRKPRYTAEYYAYKHFSHFVQKGTEMIAYSGREHSATPVVVFRNTDGQYIVTVGNFTDNTTKLSVKIGKRYLNVNASSHSFMTFVV